MYFIGKRKVYCAKKIHSKSQNASNKPAPSVTTVSLLMLAQEKYESHVLQIMLDTDGVA